MYFVSLSKGNLKKGHDCGGIDRVYVGIRSIKKHKFDGVGQVVGYQQADHRSYLRKIHRHLDYKTLQS